MEVKKEIMIIIMSARDIKIILYIKIFIIIILIIIIVIYYRLFVKLHKKI